MDGAAILPQAKDNPARVPASELASGRLNALARVPEPHAGADAPVNQLVSHVANQLADPSGSLAEILVTDAASRPNADINSAPVEETRAAPRFTLLIRAAKIISPHGEFVCVVRDVSETGVAVRLFHNVPTGDWLELHMPGGGVYALKMVWERDNEAGFEFTNPVDVTRLINEASEYPKRGLRLGLCFPIKITTLTGSHEAIVENFSQQGARFETDGLYAIDQNLRIKSAETGIVLKDVRVKVRWRRDHHYGVVFDDTLTLGDFARFAARMQCPQLLE